MQLSGIHHLTAISADAPGNRPFYEGVLGMRLVKKTVNQDDVSAYHLFYADGLATPGSDITFFDWPVGRERRGTHSITRTALPDRCNCILHALLDHISTPAIVAVMNDASVPAIMARTPMRARSLRRVGAMPPMPPI